MPRVLVPLLLLAVPAAAGEYERLLEQAHAAYWNPAPGVTQGERIDQAYEILARAALLDDARWEAFFERGLNRCRAVLFARSTAQEHVARRRAAGASPEELAAVLGVTAEFVDARLREAYQNFRAMEARMRRRGESHPNEIMFANAAMKFANREYQEARDGAPGAIDDFKTLIRRGFLEDRCREHIALCYVDMAYMAYTGDDAIQAQEYWEKALEWTENPHLRQLINTNRAGAFQLENEYVPAERILREQIAEEPYRPVHHKNLGLVLGYQNRLKEALYHYRKARDLCAQVRASFPFGALHGNAWLRAAVIHGKLLETDGDVRLAWRLFLEYRAMLGDDYNFCFWFADFCASLGQYELARLFGERARDLQPHCPAPYQFLVQIAPRTEGTPEEIERRIEEAKTAWEEAQVRFDSREESAVVRRLCSGLRDLADAGTVPGPVSRLEPDPLAAYGPEAPPQWLLEAGRGRDPFVPWRPGDAEDETSGAAAGEGVAATPSPPSDPGRGWRDWLVSWWAAAAAALALAAAAVALLVRRQARTA